jgi:hypothetical protein
MEEKDTYIKIVGACRLNVEGFSWLGANSVPKTSSPPLFLRLF